MEQTLSDFADLVARELARRWRVHCHQAEEEPAAETAVSLAEITDQPQTEGKLT